MMEAGDFNHNNRPRSYINGFSCFFEATLEEINPNLDLDFRDTRAISQGDGKFNPKGCGAKIAPYFPKRRYYYGIYLPRNFSLQ